MMRTALVVVVLVFATTPGWAQTAAPPWKAENLQFFPKDISRPALTQRMREFSLALGVRCQYCHTGGNGVSFEGVVFASDDKPAKRTARAMLRIVDQLNTTTLAQLPTRAEPRVVVECATCHRGVTLPKSLQTTLFEIVESKGAPTAIAKYRELRADALLGHYNFGKWEINELARRLSEANKPDAVIAILDSWLPCRLVSLDGTSPGRSVGPAPAQCTDAAWSADGEWMYFTGYAGGGVHT